MEATELRIGNKVMTDREGIVTVDAINRSNSKKGRRLIAITINGKFISRVFVHKINPIPLTEEWQEKLGLIDGYFGENDEYRIAYDGRLIEFSDKCKNKKAYGLVVCMLEGTVHDLQNKAFALTGHELTPKT